jgi:adenylate cyclase
MNFIFKQQFGLELLRSEKRRTIILITIFFLATLLRLVNEFVFALEDDTVQMNAMPAIWLFPFAIIIFESCSLFYINRRIKTSGRQIPLALQFVNTGIEISLPSFIILFVAVRFPSFNVLQSPAVFIYFIFIILSTLRLNYKLSIFCGMLSSTSYILLSTIIYHQFSSNDAARAFILLFSGIASGIVAHQIKSGINKSLQETEKRRKVENIFGQQISAEVAEKMLENDGKIESKRMNVAILFIDIRNFTVFVSGRNPEDIVKYQNDFFKIVINTISRHHGVVHQFLGDGCMVSFGAPIPLSNPAQYAVAAAQELLKAIDVAARNGEIEPTRIGMGLHTGEVITGNIGTIERQQYSITGNVVILASRIEQLNKQFGSQLLVSEKIIESLETCDTNLVSFGPVELKGWHKPISIYKLA